MRSIHFLSIIASLCLAACGGEALGPHAPTDLTGKDYFRGALFGRGPAATGGPVEAVVDAVGHSLEAVEHDAVIAAQEDLLSRLEKLDGAFLDRLETAAEAGDRIRLLRQLDEASLYLMLAAAIEDPTVQQSQRDILDQIAGSGGIEAMSHESVVEAAHSLGATFQTALGTADEIEPIEDIVVTTYVERTVPSCDIVVVATCALVLYRDVDLSILLNGSPQTDLQREQLVDHLVRVAG